MEIDSPDMSRLVTKLQRELDAAYERIAELEGALRGEKRKAPAALRGLSGQMQAVLGMLESRGEATSESLAVAISTPGRTPRGVADVKVIVCKMRPILKPLGVEIETVWGVGYRMPATSRRALRELRRAEAAERVDEAARAA